MRNNSGAITDFTLITHRDQIQIPYCGDRSLFSSVGASIKKQYEESYTKGLQWRLKDQVIKVYERNWAFKGFPSPAFDKVVALYERELWVFDAEGDPIQEISFPYELLYGEPVYINNKDPNPPQYFMDIYPLQRKGGGFDICVKMVFNLDWWQTRILNTVDFTFGEVVGTTGRI